MEIIEFNFGDGKLVPAADALNKEIVKTIEEKLGIELFWISNSARITFTNKDYTIGIICPKTDKPIKKDFHTEFFFSLFPYQIEYLKKFEKSFIVFICETTDKLLLFEFKDFQHKLKFITTNKKDGHSYIYIIKESKKYFLKQQKIDSKSKVEITKHLL